MDYRKPTRLISIEKETDSGNGLESLVTYYQNLFDREEKANYFSQDHYQNAKRKYVKYLLRNRDVLPSVVD